LANALNKVVAMHLCTPLQTVTMSESLKKKKNKHFVIQLDYMIVYTHTFFLLFVSNIHIHLFSVFGLGNI